MANGCLKAPLLCLKWTVDFPGLKQFAKTKFSFQERNWHMKLEREQTSCYLFLKCGDRLDHDEKFDVFVFQEHLTNFDFPVSKISYDVKLASYFIVWLQHSEDILKKLQDPGSDGKLKLHIILDGTDRSKKKNLSGKEEDKKNYSPLFANTSAQTHVSCVGVSVQTQMTMSAYSCLEQFSEDLSKLMDQDSDQDVVFRIGDQEIRAHKNVLSSRCPVFASMFQNNSIDAVTSPVKVQDMTIDTLKIFLQYLYSGKLTDLTTDTAVTLYEVGHSYKVQGLTRRCGQFLTNHLTVENVCDLLVLCDKCNDQALKKSAINYILENEVPLDDRWPDFVKIHPHLAFEVLNHFYKRETEL